MFAVTLLQTAECLADTDRWRVASVKVVGTRVRVPIRENDVVTAGVLESAAAVARQELVDRGWLRSEVRWDTVSRHDGLHVVFVVELNTRARVARWKVEGSTSYDTSHVERVLPRRGVWFSRETAESALGALLRFYETGGFPFVTVRAGAVSESLGWVVPTLLVEEGQRVWVDFISFDGQVATPVSILMRAARFRSGLFSSGAVRQWRRNLERLGWLRCDSQALVAEGNLHGVQFWVTELVSNRISGAAGYSPPEGLIGFASLQLQNLLNTGRRLSANWRARSGLHGYELSYTEPWLLGSAFSLTGEVDHTVYDTTQASTKAELTATVATSSAELGIVSGWQRVTTPAVTGSINTTWAGTILGYDVGESGPFATRGFSVTVKTSAGQRRSCRRRASVVGRLVTRTHTLVPIKEHLVWSTVLEARAVFSRETLTVPELYSLGGAKSLRGFGEDAFVTPVAVWSNLEIRYQLARTVQVYPFLDLGSYRQRGRYSPVVAYGIGAGWGSRWGKLGLDYGVAAGGDVLRGKIHLRLEGGF